MGIINRFKKMAKKVSEADTGIRLKHIVGVGNMPEGTLLNVIVSTEDHKLYISRGKKEKSILEVSLDDIEFVENLKAEEITKKDKSVVGRAAMGTLIAGPLGAMVGGLSGTGKKEKKRDHYVLTIGYEGDKHMSFLNESSILTSDGVVRKLRPFEKQ